jgi:hypothetical protein
MSPKPAATPADPQLVRAFCRHMSYYFLSTGSAQILGAIMLSAAALLLPQKSVFLGAVLFGAMGVYTLGQAEMFHRQPLKVTSRLTNVKRIGVRLRPLAFSTFLTHLVGPMLATGLILFFAMPDNLAGGILVFAAITLVPPAFNLFQRGYDENAAWSTFLFGRVANEVNLGVAAMVFASYNRVPVALGGCVVLVALNLAQVLRKRSAAANS